MSVIDVMYKILAEGYSPSEYGGTGIAVAMAASAILSVYIYFCYRVLSRRTFYSQSFNLSLLVLGPVTAGLILMMQQNAIAGVGVIGVLAIVRLRGTVKEPMDLVFILWSVACGIFIAAGMWRIGIIVSIVIAAIVIILDLLPFGRSPLILSVYGNPGEKVNLQTVCEQTIAKSCTHVKVISRGKSDGRQNLVLRVHTKKRLRLTNELAKLPEVESVTLLEQGGEVSF